MKTAILWIPPRNFKRSILSLNPLVGLADAAMESILTSQSLQNVAVCPARGYYLRSGATKLPMSPFAAEHTQAGLAFEKEIEEAPGLLLTLLRKLRPQLFFAGEPTLAWGNRDSQGKEIKGAEAASLSRTLLRGVRPAKPCLLGQLVLEPAVGLAGRPDWCFWTGKEWVLIEMKRSEMPLSIHGVQLAFYRELIQLEMGIDTPVFSEAFILHCQPGYLYVSRDPRLKQEALDHLSLAVFPLDLLEMEKNRLKAELASLQEEPSPGERCFSGACVECSFKHHCYPHFLNQSGGTSLSLIPLSVSDREIVRNLGFASLEELASDASVGKLKEFRNGRSEQIRGVRHRAAVACSLPGFSDWRSHRGWARKWMLYVYQPLRDDLPESEAWGTQVDQFVEAPQSVDQLPAVIVCYTEREVRRAKYRLRQNGIKSSDLSRVSFICLVEEIRDNVHLPFVSYTLPEVAQVMQTLTQGGGLASIIHKQLQALTSSPSWPEHHNSVHRLLLVEQVWQGLLHLEDFCWGRRML